MVFEYIYAKSVGIKSKNAFKLYVIQNYCNVAEMYSILWMLTMVDRGEELWPSCLIIDTIR